MFKTITDKVDDAEVLRMLTLANMSSINAVTEGEYIKLSDKKTGKVLQRYKPNDMSQLCCELGITQSDWGINLVANVGDNMWVTKPVFGTDSYGFTRGDCITMLPNNIERVKIRSISGSNDTSIILDGYDIDNIKIGAVQEIFFSNIEDAIEACNRTPVGGYTSWDDYKRINADLIKYKYKLKVPKARGERVRAEKPIRLGEVMINPFDDNVVSFCNRLIFTVNGIFGTNYQTTPLLIDSNTNKIVRGAKLEDIAVNSIDLNIDYNGHNCYLLVYNVEVAPEDVRVEAI